MNNLHRRLTLRPLFIVLRSSSNSSGGSGMDPSPTSPPLTPPPDPDPTTRSEIEGMINSHRSEIDKLIRRIDWLREEITCDEYVLLRLQRIELKRYEAKKMQDRILVMQDAKRGLYRNLKWHRSECARLEKLLKSVLRHDYDASLPTPTLTPRQTSPTTASSTTTGTMSDEEQGWSNVVSS